MIPSLKLKTEIERLTRELISSCTHVVAINEYGEELCRDSITERFPDGLPAPAIFRMTVLSQRPMNQVSIYLFQNNVAIIGVDLNVRPMFARHGDGLQITYEGFTISDA